MSQPLPPFAPAPVTGTTPGRESRRAWRISRTAFFLCLVASLSFVFHFFSLVLTPSIYGVAVAVAVAGYVVSKPLSAARRPVIPLCLLLVLCMAVTFWRSTRLPGALVDILVLVVAMFLVVFPTAKPKDYRPALAVMVAWGVFFAIGILLAFGARPVFNATLSFFPWSFASVVRRASTRFVCGFSTNPGFSAGYIACGIMALTATVRGRSSLSLVKILLFAFLGIAMLFTAKRGHVLFLFMAVVICYLLPMKGRQVVARYWKLFLLGLVGMALFIAFEDSLANIPFVGRAITTVTDYMGGLDVSSNRSKLWTQALDLFHAHPWIGIGWGDYRTTLVGQKGFFSDFDVHDIYLQLLCETGITGLVLFVAFFVFFWGVTRKLYRLCLAASDPVLRSLVPVLHFSILYQTFFLLYGITGNVIYDQHYQIMYMLACGMTATCREICIRRTAELRRHGGLP